MIATTPMSDGVLIQAVKSRPLETAYSEAGRLQSLVEEQETVTKGHMLGSMRDSVTVFRSADPSAHEDAGAILELLTSHGLSGDLIDDNTPGVLAGVWEVHVEAKDSEKAEALIAANPPDEDEFSDVSASHDLDLVTVFHSAGSTAEMEAMSVKGILDASGIYAMIESDPRFPNLPEEVRVPRKHLTDARRLIADALAAGAAAADEAEAAGEQ